MLREVDWSLTSDFGAGWHVILGPNGSGKSTLLRAISLALLGPNLATVMVPRWKDLLKSGADSGGVRLSIEPVPDFDQFRGRKKSSELVAPLEAGLRIRNIRGSFELSKTDNKDKRLSQSIWSDDDKMGWLSLSIGAVRRFEGSDRGLADYFSSYKRLSRHMTLFYEAISLQRAIDWLANLDDASSPVFDPNLLSRIKDLLNTKGLLPYEVRVEHLGKTISFSTPDRDLVELGQMSEGFKALLAMVFETLHGLVQVFGSQGVFSGDSSVVSAPGIVLVDEIDLHLHPEWQSRVASSLLSLFPKIQWIVTTHSPFVVHEAVNGSVLRLPDPDSGEDAFKLVGEEYAKAVYGSVEESLDSAAFGLDRTRSPRALQLLEELAMLNLTAMDRALTRAQLKRRNELQAILPSDDYVLPEDLD